ncbi:transglycosylase family protein [Streptomyces sp. NPDC057445]|uniref:transglycosylase family protein n=1 Tax=Streptomyces sp. NPDC057445 TaxID=3346136 RepID=UPI003696F504
MLSGNGRHRRPRQAPALIVAAGVTGSAIAIPLLGAGSASAADTTTWDRVADCESGGMWSADLDNGYYGGLQLSQEQWDEFGGTTYAPRPDLASRSQQIAVAEKVLAAQGPSAWASCAAITGLTTGGAKAQVDPGVTLGVQEEVDPPSFGDGRDSVVTDPSASASPESSKPSTDSSASPETSEPAGSRQEPSAPESAEGADPAEGADSGAGKHRGTAATDEDEPGNSGSSDSERDSGRHASRGDGSARDVAATPGEYTVRPGDNLWAIADANEVPGGWPALYEANEDVVGSDADLILPGQSLDLGLDQEQLKK